MIIVYLYMKIKDLEHLIKNHKNPANLQELNLNYNRSFKNY